MLNFAVLMGCSAFILMWQQSVGNVVNILDNEGEGKWLKDNKNNKDKETIEMVNETIGRIRNDGTGFN